MNYTQDNIKKLLLKKLVVFGYFDTAADYGDNDTIATKDYLWGQVVVLLALLEEPEFRDNPEAIITYNEGVNKFNSKEHLSYSDAYDCTF